MNGGAMVDEFDIGSHAFEFRYVHEALGKHGLGDDAGAIHGGQHGAKLGLHVRREPGVGNRLEMKGVSGTIGTDCDGVGSLGEGKSRMLQGGDHGAEMFRLRAGDGDALSGNCTRNKEGAGFDAVGDDGVSGAMEFRDSLDLDVLGARSGNLGTHGGQKAGQVNDFGFFGGSLDDGCSLGKNGSHHDIAGPQNGGTMAATEIDTGPREFFGMKQNVATLHGDLRPKSLEALQVEIDRAVSDDTTAGQGNPRRLFTPQKRAKNADGGAHLADNLVGCLGDDLLSTNLDNAAGTLHLCSEASQDGQHVVDVTQVGNAIDNALFLGQQGGCKNRQC